MDVEGAFDTVLQPIYRLSNPKGRFGYADDTAVLCVGDSLEETAHRASKHVHELMTWGTANAITFDPKKTEVMHFSRTTPRNAPPVFHGEVEKRPGSAMRWLGIWLDSTLTFKTHVEKWTAKAQAVAYHLKEAWYPGMTCPRWNKPAKEGPSRIRHLIRRMDKSLNTAMRAILPVWKTTPLSARHREAGIPPSQVLDEAHPLAVRTKPIRAPVINRAIKLKYQRPRQPFRTRLRRTDELLPRCARPDLLAQSAANFGEWLQSVAPRTAIVYSDGSLSRREPRKEFLEFQALAAEHGATEIRWIPGHTNIPGSDQKTHSKPGGKFLHPNKATTGTSLITTKG
ncbi:reverse transcriptase [Hirsutella rhossiliensis]|uniref:Reverse transcriptase n=1 Tax=Hirsutella rhossiliensis TaxID=111463 RepID=A0A9P8NCU2_9HYPO|nr:reverse transcriptase [Hirsutella rhossiliensis]KAH0968787.1 reverse transcriptase [Hirsutella rhossiliensis]